MNVDGAARTINELRPLDSSLMKSYLVRANWDSEARVWVATSDDVPGLVTEADTSDQLLEKLKVMIPELLELNGVMESDRVPFQLVSECTAIASREQRDGGLFR